MHLLDTNIISELKKPRPHGGVLAWFRSNPYPSLRISSVTIYELQSGAERTRRQDRLKAAELDEWIAALQRMMTVLPFDSLEARITAYLMRGLAIEQLQDAMIAATATAHGLPVATRNTRDFERFGVPLVNPFEFKG